MADLENPPQQTITTTEEANNKKQIYLRYDSSYARRKGGIFKIIQIFFSFFGFICIQCTYLAIHPTAKWFTTVSVAGVWVTGILLLCYLFHFVEKFYQIPWIKFELFYCTILALCFLIASCMAAPMEHTAFQAAAFFGFSAMVVYAVDAYSKYLAVKSDEPAQGERQIDKETVAITAPP